MRYKNPVYPGYLADPFIWKHESTWYAIGTGRPGAHAQASRGEMLTTEGRPGVFRLLQSGNFSDWTPVGAALELLSPDFGDDYWAPEIAFHEGIFYLYYSVGYGDKAHHVRVATSPRPTGPFRDTGALLTNPYSCPFAIDAAPFQDEDGECYIFYSRDIVDTLDGFRAGTAIVVDRLLDMNRLAGEERIVLRARHNWQRYQADRVMYGGRYDWHTIEGPCVRKRNGLYYCLFSGGRWEDDTYGVDWVCSDKVTGPYIDATHSDGARLLRTIPGKVLGPGHNSIAPGPDGSDFLVYHAWDVDKTGRRLCIDPLQWTPDGPRTSGPSYTEQWYDGA